MMNPSAQSGHEQQRARFSNQADATLTTHPSSYGQRALWYIEQMTPPMSAYNVAFPVRIRAPLDTQALQRVIQTLTERHAALRTTFAATDENVVQQIPGQVDAHFECIDATGWTADELTAQIARMQDRPFDLASGPLMRTYLFTCAPEDHVLLMMWHHAVVDGWSVGLLARELHALYIAETGGASARLAPPAMQYTDYVNWQTGMLAGPEGTRLRHYWHEQLSGELPALNLPTDYPRPARQTFRGATGRIDLGSELFQQLRDLAHAEQTTLFTVLLAGYTALLQRYTGQEDIIVGAPFAARSHAEFRRTVGYLINLVAIRTHPAGATSFRHLLAATHQLVQAALSHQDYPFPLLVEELKPARDPGRPAIIETTFNLQKVRRLGITGDMDGARQQPGNRPTLPMEPYPLLQQDTPFDLMVDAFEVGPSLHLVMHYNTDLFAAATITRMLDHFQRLLAGLVADPDQAIGALPLLTPAEQQTLLVDWNATHVPYPADQCVHDLISAQATRTPEAVAVVYQDQELTYGELNRRANQLAHYLRHRGVGPETLVGLAIGRTLELPVALLGILKAGGAYLPLDPSYPAERLAFMLEDSGTKVVVTADQPTALAQNSGGSLAHIPSHLQHELALVDLVAEADAIACEPVTEPTNEVTPARLAYVIYTSGSTGQPKGVMVQHGGVVNHNCAVAQAFALTPADRVLQFATINFDTAVEEIFPTWISGATLVLRPDGPAPDMVELLRLVEDERLTVLNLPTAYWHTWTIELARSGVQLPAALRLVIVGGEAALAEHLTTWQRLAPGTRWLNTYGPTETTVIAGLYEPDTNTHLASGQPVPIGRPIANTSLYILDHTMQPVPVGVPGELYIGGAGVARGYLNRPDLTAERFVANPFAAGRLYRTGDLARYLPDGNVEFLGRTDHQVKIRGFRIELGEIETALREHPAVREAVVVDGAAPAGGRRLLAYLTAAGEQTPASSDLRQHLRARLPDYMVPAAFTTLAVIPLTPNGKIDRRALPAPDDAPADEQDVTAPRTSVEQLLCGIWTEVLGITAVGIHSNFFDLGGHSLLAAQIIARVQEVFQIELPVRTLFEGPTIAELAHHISQALAGDTSPDMQPIQPIPRDGPLPVSFSQQRLWFFDQESPGSSAYTIPVSLRLHGALDVAALEQALNLIVRRHEGLRTTFTSERGRPVAQVTPYAPVALARTDLTDLPPDEHDAALHQCMVNEIQPPFDLARPLYRLRLIRVGPEEHLLLFTMHHIVSDGWSVGVLLRELERFYNGFARGETPEVADLPIQYADFAHWQREQLQGPALEHLLTYWRQQLAGAPPHLELPTDFPRPAVQTFAGAHQTLTLPAALVKQVEAMSRAAGATSFMTLLAVFKLLLARQSGQEDIVIGLPIAGRTRVETEGLIGFFINNLVLRTDLAGNPTFREVLQRVRATALGAYEHQDLPFDKLVAELKPQRDPSRSVMFQVQFNLIPQVERLNLQHLEAEVLPPPEADAKYDLSLYLYAGEHDYTMRLVYNGELFTAERMRDIAAQYRQLLEQVTQHPDTPIAELSLVSDHVRLCLPDPTAPLHPGWTEPVHERIARQAHSTPARIAITDRAGSWTYGDLNQYADRLAGVLQVSGLQPGGIVAVYAHRSAALAWALLAIWKAGGTFIILDPRYPAARLIDSLTLAQPDVWLQLEAGGPPPAALLNCLDELGCTSRHMLPAGVEASGALLAEAAGYTPVPVGPDDQAYIAFTSGSMGRQKAIIGTHQPLAHFITWHVETFGLHADDRFSMLSGLAHDPLLRDIFTPLSIGATLCIPDPDDIEQPDRLLHWMQAQAVSIAHLTPPLSQIMLPGSTEQTRDVLPALRYAFFGGDQLTGHHVAQLRAAAPEITCVNFYGATETPQAMGYYLVHDALTDSATVPVGRGIEGVQLLVLNATGQISGVGEPGEIYIRSPYLARGYLGDDALTTERFITNPFTGAAGDRLYRTGDLGRYLPDGSVMFSGRNDQQVKIRGFRIELGEIESVLREHPAVREAVVVDGAAPAGGRRLLAYLTAAGEQPPASSELRRHLRARLPDYMVPARFITLEAIPLTPNGKVDRRALPDPEHTRATGRSQVVAPSTAMERIIAQIWREALGVEQIGVHDNFFDLGGHSLLAVQIMAQIEQQTGIMLNPATLRAQTLGQIAAMYTAQQASAQSNPQDKSQDKPQPQEPAQEHPVKRMRGAFKRLVTGRQS
ncbi:MAG: amino acid adenylation domain-containing protein [Chloroflexaceae bacterium]